MRSTTDRVCAIKDPARERVPRIDSEARPVRLAISSDQPLNIADAVCVLDWLLVDGAAPGCVPAADANGDGESDTSDAIYLLLFLSTGGVAPVAPSPMCGRSTVPTDEMMGCETPPTYCR